MGDSAKFIGSALVLTKPRRTFWILSRILIDTEGMGMLYTILALDT